MFDCSLISQGSTTVLLDKPLLSSREESHFKRQRVNNCQQKKTFCCKVMQEAAQRSVTIQALKVSVALDNTWDATSYADGAVVGTAQHCQVGSGSIDRERLWAKITGSTTCSIRALSPRSLCIITSELQSLKANTMWSILHTMRESFY